MSGRACWANLRCSQHMPLLAWRGTQHPPPPPQTHLNTSDAALAEPPVRTSGANQRGLSMPPTLLLRVLSSISLDRLRGQGCR